MRLFLSAIFSLSAAVCCASDPDAWTNAPLGIAISECSYDAHGVEVRFATDLQPPYLVGVYRSEEIGLHRRFPVAEVLTESTLVRIPVRTMDATLFVQVMTTNAEQFSRRTISHEEYRQFIDKIQSSPIAKNQDPATTWEYVRNDPSMELISDNTWIGFRMSDEPDVSLGFSGRTSIVERLEHPSIHFCKVDTARYVFADGIPSEWKFVPKSDWASRKTSTFTNGTVRCDFEEDRETQSNWYYGMISFNRGEMFEHVAATNGSNAYVTILRYHDAWKVPNENVSTPVYGLSDPITFSTSITDADVSVGTGYRIIFFDDLGIVQAQRAYSARTNMSDEVIIERGFKSLSAHDGYRYTKDFDGRVYWQADTNTVPDRINTLIRK